MARYREYTQKIGFVASQETVASSGLARAKQDLMLLRFLFILIAVATILLSQRWQTQCVTLKVIV
jgi:hypothetical protein